MVEAVSSIYPAPPAPVAVELTTIPPHDCPYLPDREATLRAIYAQRMSGEVFQGFLDAGFRRSGAVIYQPICRGCRECRPLRVPISTFQPSKSQRRCRKRNSDLKIDTAKPQATDEKHQLYRRYQTQWHGVPEADDRAAFERFLYRSPVKSIEFCYRDEHNRLLAVGICDLCPNSLSSVYFYFDPDERERGLGTFGALCEIDYAEAQGMGHYYLGFWVQGCRKMRYKADFRPCQILGTDGCWGEA